MEKIKREIRLFLVSYGRLFLFIIGIICAVIFIIQSLNSMVIQQNNNKYSSEEYKKEQETREEQNKDREYISQFIDYCNQGKIEQAYEMLSNKCKEEKYSTVEEFKNKYINKVFSISICEYKIIKEDNIYIITLTQDMLVTGKSDSTIEEKYQINNVLERKIYII